MRLWAEIKFRTGPQTYSVIQRPFCFEADTIGVGIEDALKYFRYLIARSTDDYVVTLYQKIKSGVLLVLSNSEYKSAK